MANMNSTTRKRLFKRLVARDGAHCRICNKKGNEKTLVIDHIDNDNSNDAFWNLQLLCHPDNTRKNPRGKGKKHSHVYVCGCVGVCVCEDTETKSAEFKKNKESEGPFRHWLYEEVRKHKRVTWRHVLDAGAEKVHCSQETIKRYGAKCCSAEGLFEQFTDLNERREVEKYVELKPLKIIQKQREKGKDGADRS